MGPKNIFTIYPLQEFQPENGHQLDLEVMDYTTAYLTPGTPFYNETTECTFRLLIYVSLPTQVNRYLIHDYCGGTTRRTM